MTATPTQKAILVYRQRLLGKSLAGWVDEKGDTFRTGWPSEPQLAPHWLVDEQKRIFIEVDDIRSFAGWIEGDGQVYAQYGQASSGAFSYPANTQLIKPKVTFSPALVFEVRADGTVYRPGWLGKRIVGKIEGTSDLDTIAALALLLLL